MPPSAGRRVCRAALDAIRPRESIYNYFDRRVALISKLTNAYGRDVMKLALGILLGALLSTSAFATDGQSTGCFDAALEVPETVSAGAPQGQVLIATDVMVCTSAKNLKPVDPDGIVFTGDITIKVVEKDKTVASYQLSAASSEGGLGTIYTAYGSSVEDVSNQTDKNAYKLASFRMRNDHIPKGEVAGRVNLFGHELTLIQR